MIESGARTSCSRSATTPTRWARRALLDRNIFGPYAGVMRTSAWFPALGNHDVKENGGKPELEAFHSLGKERWYRFTWGNTAMVVLDSNVSVGPGSASCTSPAALWRSPPASASPPGITRPGSPRGAVSRLDFAADRAAGRKARRTGGVRGPPACLRSQPPAQRGAVRGRRHRWSRTGVRRRRTDDPVRARRGRATMAPCELTSRVARRGSATRRSTARCATTSASGADHRSATVDDQPLRRRSGLHDLGSNRSAVPTV